MNKSSYLRDEQYRDSRNLDARRVLHERFSVHPRRWYGWMFDHFEGLAADARVLEVGCGSGHLWLRNLERVSPRWDVVLSDFSPGMVAEARSHLDGDARFTFAAFDAESVPFSAGHFDAVIANHMLYHVPDRPKALAELARVLKPGGVFFAATNGAGHMAEIDGWLAAAGLGAKEKFRVDFSLENGRAQLEGIFEEVTLDLHDDGLVVTEVSPVVDYILSARPAGLKADEEARLRRVLEDELQASGALRIGKACGVFRGRAPG